MNSSIILFRHDMKKSRGINFMGPLFFENSFALTDLLTALSNSHAFTEELLIKVYSS